MKHDVSHSTPKADHLSPSVLLILAVVVFFVGATEFMLSSMFAPLAAAFNTSTVGASWLVSSYALSYALAAPVFGYFSDRMDRRTLLLAALTLFAIDGMAIVLAPTLEIAIALRVFGGLASAALIPTAFALIADLVRPERQAGAMGVVMLGMTFGIALGPALAGVLTDYIGWHAPFLLTSFGCLIAFAAGVIRLPKRTGPLVRRTSHGLQWMARWSVVRPLVAKGAWNGTGVAAFLVSGEVLRQRYGFGPAEVGVTVTAFGVGLGLGNMSAGPLRRLCGREEVSLLLITSTLTVAIAVFMIFPLPLLGTLACLTIWGAALGAGAPSSTVVLAGQAGADKGIVLAFAETFNNVAILAAVPLATTWLVKTGASAAMLILSVGLGLGLLLTILDYGWSRARQT